MSGRAVTTTSVEERTDRMALPKLCPRELDVLAEIAQGASNTVVAQQLSLQPDTVKRYLRNAMRKLHATNRHEAVRAARDWGLLGVEAGE